MIKKTPKEYEDLICNIFPNCDKFGYSLKITIEKPIVYVDIKDINDNVLFCGMSKCHPDDEWDERLGVAIALTRLRVCTNAYSAKLKENKKPWVPKVGETYYECYFDNGDLCVDGIKWQNSDYDYIQLSDGNVFKTLREARKHGRRSIFNGRKIAKEARRA